MSAQTLFRTVCLSKPGAESLRVPSFLTLKGAMAVASVAKARPDDRTAGTAAYRKDSAQ